MRLEAKKYLHDVAAAARLAIQFTRGKRFEDYSSDAMLRSAVERQLGIVGEAVAQLAKVDEAVAAQISEHKRIVAFRNILIHGYTNVDDRIVWDVIQFKLPGILAETEVLLASG